jgi:hypothetical protein
MVGSYEACVRGRVAVKALCVRVAGEGDQDSWLTLNHEYQVLSILMTPKGPAKLRMIADDGRTPVLTDASLFVMSAQPFPPNWVVAIGEGGVVELGPTPWLEPGFWERYFDSDADAILQFQEEIMRMESAE